MKKPVIAFTSIAALAVAALGGTLYYQRSNPVPAAQVAVTPEIAPVVTAKPETEKAAEVAVAAPKAETVVPSFDTVRVESSGEAVIAGRAEPDAQVLVKWNGNIIGETKASADGSFVVVPEKALSKGTGTLTLEVSKNGAVTQSEGSVVVAVKENAPALVAKVDPVAPTKVLQAGDASVVAKEVQLTAVDYDAAGNIVFSGKSLPGSVVRFYVDNTAAGEGVADATGTWSFKGSSAVTPGKHILRADALDAAGKVISRIELPFFREAAETVAAAAEVAPAKPAEAVATAEPAVKLETQVAAAPTNTTETDKILKKIVIQPGNSLWKLSREVYGKGRMFTVIYEANRDQLKNPNKIFPGQVLTAPKQN
jgi:nucleoid-associated protein YgaU